MNNLFSIVCFFLIGILAPGCSSTRSLRQESNRQQPLVLLKQQIDAALQDSSLTQSTTGIKVVSLVSGEILYQKDSARLFHPASNMKLLTTAAALNRLGPGFKFRTTLAADSVSFADSTITGNLYLKGFADPLLTDADLRRMIAQLHEKGIRQVTGNLVCDATYLDTLRLGVGWMWDDVNGSDWAPISALTVNHNTVRVIVSPAAKAGDRPTVRLDPPTAFMPIENYASTVDSTDTLALRNFAVERHWQIPRDILTLRGGIEIGSQPRSREIDVVDPALYTGTVVSELLRDAGVALYGKVIKGAQPDSTLAVADHFSDTLGEIVTKINKPSDNLYAEMLLKTLAAESKGPPGTAANGIAIVKEVLHEAGIDTNLLYLVDASGVSRYNLISPDQMIKLLIKMHEDFAIQAEFKASLPIAAIDGTLQNRMKETAAAAKLRAKTGSLRGVSTLAGYTTTAEGELIAFSIMMQHFVGPTRLIRNVQDRIGAIISGFSRKGPPLEQP